MDFFLQEIKKDTLTIKYSDSAEFFAVTSEKNIGDISKLKKYFTCKNFSEDDESITPSKNIDEEVLPAYAIRIDEKKYLEILKEVDSICKKRCNEFFSFIEMTPEEEGYKENEFISDNLLEILSFRRFLNKYLNVIQDNEYKDKTYYSLFVE